MCKYKDNSDNLNRHCKVLEKANTNLLSLIDRYKNWKKDENEKENNAESNQETQECQTKGTMTN